MKVQSLVILTIDVQEEKFGMMKLKFQNIELNGIEEIERKNVMLEQYKKKVDGNHG